MGGGGGAGERRVVGEVREGGFLGCTSAARRLDASLPALQQDFVRYGRMCYTMFLYSGSRSRVCFMIFDFLRNTLSVSDLL